MVRIQSYHMVFTISIATNVNAASLEVYHLASERLCFNVKDECSGLEAIDTVFEV